MRSIKATQSMVYPKTSLTVVEPGTKSDGDEVLLDLHDVKCGTSIILVTATLSWFGDGVDNRWLGMVMGITGEWRCSAVTQEGTGACKGLWDGYFYDNENLNMQSYRGSGDQEEGIY